MLKSYNPTTAGRRGAIIDAREDVTKDEPEKSLVIMQKRGSGRNNQGKITVRHRGGGEKRYIRIVDFIQNREDKARVLAIEYDPGRSSRIALLEYPGGARAYIICPVGLHVGDELHSSFGRVEVKPGNRMPLQYMPIGSMIHNLELVPGQGGKIIRSAGGGAQLLAVEGDLAQIKMPSGEVRLIRKEARASLGQVSNPDHHLIRLGRAGTRRHLGWRPAVRGKVMNPVDHPHGGGEGRNSIGLPYPKTPWGKHALGVKTRKKNKYSNKFIVKRRK